MDYKEFVNYSVNQDKRNLFEEYSENTVMIPLELKDFFQKYNPIDVEVTMADNVIRFIPVQALKSLQEEYGLGNENFIFATCNGDPIYYNNRGIFSCYHASANSQHEKLASSFGEFLDLIDR